VAGGDLDAGGEFFVFESEEIERSGNGAAPDDFNANIFQASDDGGIEFGHGDATVSGDKDFWFFDFVFLGDVDSESFSDDKEAVFIKVYVGFASDIVGAEDGGV